MFIKWKNTAIIVLLFSLMSMFAFSQTNPSPEPPVISQVSQDRLMVNDLLTITGKNFIPAGDFPQTFVVFKNLQPILVIPTSDTQISVLVPEGAKSGDIKVKTICAVDETPYELESNPVKILILWKEISLTAIANAISPDPARPYRFWNYLFPGANDDVFAFFVNSYNKTDPSKVVQIFGDGSWIPVQFPPAYLNIPGFASSSFIAIDPIDYEYTYCFYSPSTNPRYSCLVAPAFSSICKQTYPTPQWAPFEVGYDNEGRLYVLGRLTTNQLPYISTSSIWRFNRGESVNLDPNSANSLFPGGFYGDLGNLTVAGDGSVYVQYYSLTSTQMIYIPSNGTGYQLYQWPTGNYAYCEDQWKMTADCSGRGYAINPDPWCNTPTIYSLPGNVPVAALPSGLTTDGLDYITHDGYGNLFVSAKYTGTNNDVIRRITPQDMPQGYYDCFTCCPDDPDETCKDGVGDINECEEEGLAIELITNTTGNTEAETEVCIIPSDPNQLEKIPVLFGDAPKVKFHKKDCQGDPIMATCAVSAENPTPDLGIDANKSLFKDKPEIIFGDISAPSGNSEVQFQTVHTGSFQMTITPKDTTIKPITITFKINKPAKLGTTYNNYDTEIIKYADKYGIPPQYIKAQADMETKFHPDYFRYEPLSWDISGYEVTKWSNEKWKEQGSSKSAFCYPNGTALEGVLDKVNSFCYGTITVPQGPNAVPIYNSCTPYYEYAEDNFDVDPDNPKPVRARDVYNFNNGWADNTVPQLLYSRTTPCPNPCMKRQNWDIERFSSALAFHNYQYYCGTSTAPNTSCTERQQSAMTWLTDAQNYDVYAQIPVCSSYGLLQVLYFTAIARQWKKDDPDLTHRRPEELLGVDVNLDIGVGYDSTNLKKKTQIENSSDVMSYKNALQEGFRLYNIHKEYKETDGTVLNYGEKMLKVAPDYEPKS